LRKCGCNNAAHLTHTTQDVAVADHKLFGCFLLFEDSLMRNIAMADRTSASERPDNNAMASSTFQV
jgi:hypothetical protein